MSDLFAPLALDFLDRHAPPPPALLSFADAGAWDRAIYDFLATHHPNVHLTAITVKNLGWSIRMLMYRPAK